MITTTRHCPKKIFAQNNFYCNTICLILEYLRGPDIDLPFGQQIAEYSWEAFGILCK